MDFDIHVPYGSDGNLGAEYNRIMEGISDWVLFLDHDVLILNKHWYKSCSDAIDNKGHSAGWISCVTNRIYCPDQRRLVEPSDDLNYHIEIANRCWEHYSDETYSPITNTPFSGFFILTHKKAWEDVGGFSDGFLGVDQDYYEKLIDKGYKSYIMPGIYAYHLHSKKRLLV